MKSNMLQRLASPEEAVRREVIAQLLRNDQRHHAEDMHSFVQLTMSLFEEEWTTTSEREQLIRSLSRIFADPQTDLSSVNLLAYALASEGEDGVTELLALLEHDDFSVNTYAAEGIGALNKRARWAVPALVRFLDKAHQPWTRDTVFRALGNIGGAQAIAALQSSALAAHQEDPLDEYLVSALESALASALVQA